MYATLGLPQLSPYSQRKRHRPWVWQQIKWLFFVSQSTLTEIATSRCASEWSLIFSCFACTAYLVRELTSSADSMFSHTVRKKLLSVQVQQCCNACKAHEGERGLTLRLQHCSNFIFVLQGSAAVAYLTCRHDTAWPRPKVLACRRLTGLGKHGMQQSADSESANMPPG